MRPLYEIAVDHAKAEQLGLEGAMIAKLIAQKLEKFPFPGDVELPIVVSIGPGGESVDISKLAIALPDGGQIPVSAVATIQLNSAPTTLIRVDSQRTIEIHIQPDSQESYKSIRRGLEPVLDRAKPEKLNDEFRSNVVEH